MSNLIFLTGGTGFLGHHLVPRLRRAGYRVRLLARPASRVDWLPRQGVEIFPGDVTDPAGLEIALHGCSAVIHAAGLFRFWGAEEAFERVNHHGTRLVAQAAVRAGVERFVHISTIAVVGRPPSGPFDENVACRPQDAYQRSKLAGERAVRTLAEREGLRTVILRPGGFYGPGGWYGFNRLFVLDPLRGLRVQVERGRRYIFPVYIADVAETILTALSRAPAGETYHVCDAPVTHAHVNRLVSELAGIARWRVNVPRPIMLAFASLLERVAAHTGREPFYPLNLRHYVFQDWRPTHHKARRDLGFTPTPLREGLRATVAWARRALKSAPAL